MLCHITSLAATFIINPRGRTSIPAAIRREAGIDGATELVAHVEGLGRIVLETRAAVHARIWSYFPELEEIDATADVRQLRNDDIAASDAIYAYRQSLTGPADELAAFVHELGL